MEELKELRPPHKGKGKGNPRGGGNKHPKRSNKATKNWKKGMKGHVAAAIKQHMEDEPKLKEQEEGEIAEIAKIISAAQPKLNQDATAAMAAMKLNTILKRTRDQ